MKKLLLNFSIILFSISVYGQNSKNELVGTYLFYSIKEDTSLIYIQDGSEYPLGEALHESIRDSRFEITADSLISVDARGRRKGANYKLDKKKGEMIVTENGKASMATYTFEKEKLVLFIKEDQSKFEFILIKKP